MRENLGNSLKFSSSSLIPTTFLRDVFFHGDRLAKVNNYNITATAADILSFIVKV